MDKIKNRLFEELNEPLERKDLTSNLCYFSLNFQIAFLKNPLNHSFTAISPNILEQLESISYN